MSDMSDMSTCEYTAAKYTTVKYNNCIITVKYPTVIEAKFGYPVSLLRVINRL